MSNSVLWLLSLLSKLHRKFSTAFLFLAFPVYLSFPSLITSLRQSRTLNVDQLAQKSMQNINQVPNGLMKCTEPEIAQYYAPIQVKKHFCLSVSRFSKKPHLIFSKSQKWFWVCILLANFSLLCCPKKKWHYYVLGNTISPTSLLGFQCKLVGNLKLWARIGWYV